MHEAVRAGLDDEGVAGAAASDLALGAAAACLPNRAAGSSGGSLPEAVQYMTALRHHRGHELAQAGWGGCPGCSALPTWAHIQCIDFTFTAVAAAAS